MYKTIIYLKDSVGGDRLLALTNIIEKAFVNRVGSLRNVGSHPREFIFQGNEDYYGCLDLAMLSLGGTPGFLNFVHAWAWIDEDPDENCDMLGVFARHPLY